MKIKVNKSNAHCLSGRLKESFKIIFGCIGINIMFIYSSINNKKLLSNHNFTYFRPLTCSDLEVFKK